MSALGLGLGMPPLGIIGRNTAGEPVDAHILGGQSNGTTNGGTAATTPNAPQGEYYDADTNTWTSMADGPTSPAAATLAPALVNEWFVLTGRRSMVLNTAIGSTRLLDYGDPVHSWAPAPAGTLRAPMIAKVQEFVAAIAERGYRLNKVYLHMLLGEGDAENLDGSHTAAMYTAAYLAFATELKAAVPELTQIIICRTAANTNDRTKDAGYHSIHVAQQDAADTSDLITMGYTGTLSFRSRNLMNDDLHYTQTGKNLAGKCQARATYAPYSAPTAPTVLGSFTIAADTDYATAVSSRTDSITIPAGTGTIVYMPGSQRPGNTTTFLHNPPTINGVAMVLNREMPDNNTSPACRASSAIFELDLATYVAAKGASWDGVTTNLVTSTSTDGVGGTAVTVNLMNGSGVYLETVVRDWHDITSLTGTTTGTNVTSSFMTGHAAVTVVSASSSGAGAAKLTATMAGATLLSNNGASNGTRAGQTAMGYQSDAALHGITTTGPTFSGTCDAIGQVVASYRKPLDGETTTFP